MMTNRFSALSMLVVGAVWIALVWGSSVNAAEENQLDRFLKSSKKSKGSYYGSKGSYYGSKSSYAKSSKKSKKYSDSEDFIVIGGSSNSTDIDYYSSKGSKGSYYKSSKKSKSTKESKKDVKKSKKSKKYKSDWFVNVDLGNLTGSSSDSEDLTPTDTPPSEATMRPSRSPIATPSPVAPATEPSSASTFGLSSVVAVLSALPLLFVLLR